MSRRYTFAATLCWGGDIQTGEAEVECSYAVAWGRPARGPSYASGGEPADPDEICDVRILKVDGAEWTKESGNFWPFAPSFTEASDMLAEKLVDENWDDMIEQAIEEDAQ